MFIKQTSYSQNEVLGMQLVYVFPLVPHLLTPSILPLRSILHPSWLLAWEPPPPPFFKLNFDSLFCGTSAATDIIIRDSRDLLKAATFNLGSSTVSGAEATALQQRIRFAHQFSQMYLVSAVANC